MPLRHSCIAVDITVTAVMRWWILLYTYAVLGSLVDGETVIPNDFPGAEEDRQRKRRLLCDAATILSFQPRKRPKRPPSAPPRKRRSLVRMDWDSRLRSLSHRD